MASLTGQTIQSTYDALLKISGNDALTSSLQRITDGLGNFSPLYLSTTAVEISSGLNVVGSITGSNLSGTNTGDETNSTIKSKLGAATSSNDGYLTATDWSTFNAKQNALGYTPVPNTRSLTINGTAYDLSADRIWSVGTVTSVGLSVPTGFAVSNSPVTGSGTLGLSFAAGYSLPTNLSQASWDTAFSSRIATFTTTGNSGAATFASNTLNIPNYTLSGLGGVPTTRTLTINGTSYDLSADRSWTISTGLSGSGTTNYIPKFTGSTSLGNSLIFDNGTNVGIGTTSPSSFSILDANGQVRVSSNSVIGFYQARTSDSAGSGVFGGNSFSLRNGATSEDLAFDIFNRSTSAWYTPMIIKNATGNVGIAKTSPTNPLHIGTGANSILLDGVKVDRDPSTTSSAIFNAFGGGANIISNGGATSSFPPIIFSSSDGTTTNERVRITGAGNVGIGTSSPAALFHLQSSLTGTSTFSNVVQTWRTGSGTDILLQFSDVSNQAYIGYLSGGLYFGTGGANERMRITSGGNVGIGTTSPTGELHIFGSNPALRLQGATTGNMQFGQWDGTNNRIQGSGRDFLLINTDATNMLFSTNNTERMRISSSGNVGIGTSTFAGDELVMVSMNGTSNSQAINVKDRNASANSSTFMVFRKSDDTFLGNIRRATTDDALYVGGNSYLALGTGGNTERMRITSGGTLLLGTTSDAAGGIFQAGSSDSTTIAIRTTGPGNGQPGIRFFHDGNDEFVIRGGDGLRFLSSGVNERMRITSGGNVGIGTTAPGERLTVNGGLGFQFSGTQNWHLSTNSSNNLLFTRSGIADRMVITSDGNVGIGTSSPQGVFEAVGLSYFTRSGQSLLINPNYAGGNQHIQLQATGSMALSFATGGDNERMRIASDGAIQMRNVYNRQTASYTLVLGDAGKIVEMNVAGTNNNLTVPPNSSVAFPIGTEIFVTQYGSGQTSFVAGSGVTIRSDAGKLTIANQYKGACLVKVGTDEWYLIGSLK